MVGFMNLAIIIASILVTIFLSCILSIWVPHEKLRFNNIPFIAFTIILTLLSIVIMLVDTRAPSHSKYRVTIFKDVGQDTYNVKWYNNYNGGIRFMTEGGKEIFFSGKYLIENYPEAERKE